MECVASRELPATSATDDDGVECVEEEGPLPDTLVTDDDGDGLSPSGM